MGKEEYIELEIEVITFEAADIITASELEMEEGPIL
jgi:hypothetical protein